MGFISLICFILNSSANPSDFVFLRIIGKGSFGKVYLAQHKTESIHFAIKVLDKKHILARNEVKHIMCERNVLLKNINHPFLVGLHYSFQTKDKLYFVLDFINGGEVNKCFKYCISLILFYFYLYFFSCFIIYKKKSDFQKPELSSIQLK